MISRRTLFLTPLALVPPRAAAQAAQAVRLPLAIHGNTTLAAGYRRSMEGWAKAGITHVELVAEHVDEFLKTDSIAAARRVLTDNGLTPVSVDSRVNMFWEPHPDNAKSLDNDTRFIPGDGISPLNAMIRKVVDTGYRGALSVELFLARLRQGDPYEAAREIRQKAEPVMRAAGVL